MSSSGPHLVEGVQQDRNAGAGLELPERCFDQDPEGVLEVTEAHHFQRGDAQELLLQGSDPRMNAAIVSGYRLFAGTGGSRQASSQLAGGILGGAQTLSAGKCIASW